MTEIKKMTQSNTLFTRFEDFKVDSSTSLSKQAKNEIGLVSSLSSVNLSQSKNSSFQTATEIYQKDLSKSKKRRQAHKSLKKSPMKQQTCEKYFNKKSSSSFGWDISESEDEENSNKESESPKNDMSQDDNSFNSDKKSEDNDLSNEKTIPKNNEIEIENGKKKEDFNLNAEIKKLNPEYSVKKKSTNIDLFDEFYEAEKKEILDSNTVSNNNGNKNEISKKRKEPDFSKSKHNQEEPESIEREKKRAKTIFDSEDDEEARRRAKQKLADKVIEGLMPSYKSGKIKSKAEFKATAARLSHACARAQIKDEKAIKKAVEIFLADGHTLPHPKLD